MAGERAARLNNRPSWRSRVPHLFYGPLLRFMFVVAVAVTALVLGYLGLRQYLARPSLAKLYGRSWADILYYDIQLPVLNAAPAGGAGPFPVELGIARLLAPVSTFLAAVGTLALLLGEQWRRLRIATAFRQVIVAGDGPLALTLARNLRAEKRMVVLVSSDDATLSEARRRDLLAFRGDPADPGTLRDVGVARASELFACAGQGTVNLAITLRARDAMPPARKRPLAAYALMRDAELGVPLRARRIGVAGDPRLRLDFFAIEDIAARRLYDSHPLPSDGDSPVQVVISGFGQLGHAVLREIARQHRSLPGSPPPIDVVIRHSNEAEVAKVAAGFPAICESCSITCDETLNVLGTGGYLCYVCLDGDDAALSDGLALAHSLATRKGHVVVCLRESDPLGEAIDKRSGLVDVMEKLSVFGIFEEACVPGNIRDDFTEQLARSIHAAYVANQRAKGETEDVNPSMARWEELTDDLRHANIDQAADLGAKLAEIDAVVIPETAGAPEFAFTDKNIERLAELEHERWMRERRAQGWTYGRVRDNARKVHPALVPWAALDDDDKDKDRSAIRTLPATLHDAGFQILRLPKD
jgi:hypothetical protein